jgi:protein phosphatase
LRSFGLSDKGMVRSNNQDSYGYKECDGFCYFIICDGMGGAAAGYEASSKAVKTMSDGIEAEITSKTDVKEAQSILRKIVRNTNAFLNDLSSKSAEYAGMGTTVVLMLYIYEQNKGIFLNIGDSRGYLIRNKGIKQITVDHSLVQEMVIKGQITKEQAITHPNKNIITKALGPDKDIHPDTFVIDFRKGDIALLCSDGLCNMLSEFEILDTVYSNSNDLLQASTSLINKANLKGGTDNITVVLCCIE